MVTVNIVCVGKLKEKYLKDACLEYQKRLTRFCRLNIIETDEEKLPENPSLSQIQNALEKEGKRIISRLPKSRVIAMCIEGRQISSAELAKRLEDLPLYSGSDLSIVIGGSNGLCEDVKRMADERISVSKMTFPHQLFRVMLLEQVYRAFHILNDGKYHK